MRNKLMLFCIVTMFACNNKSKNEIPAGKTDSPSVNNNAPIMDSASMMKAMDAYMSPGKLHQMMANYNGTWKAKMALRESPEAPERLSDHIVTYRMILGGRFQEGTYTGTFMGRPFEGVSLLGYDNALKKFTSSWADNMGTCIVFMQGSWDEETKTIHFTGKTTDPVSGKEINMRENFTFVDDKNQHLETFMDIGGKEFKTMDIKFSKD